MKRVHPGFLAGKEDRAHLNSLGAETERCRDTASVGYTACRHYGDLYSSVECFCSFLFRKVLSLLWFLSGCKLLAGNSLCSSANGPDEAQQFTGNCRDDLPLVLAGCPKRLEHP